MLTTLLVFVGLKLIAQAPAPLEPVPSQRQLTWQELEFYGFLHFSINTFTNQEWGYGDKPASIFNPTELDARQWARVAKDAGMKGLIITAKHHDGFCLWPSEGTEYSVKNSPWRNGKGDVIKELAEACKEYGLKMGIYLSPWDRNSALYGTPEYIDYFRSQLRDLLTNYGDVFEVWFDGANGGDGYYGGASETRKVDKLTYYDWSTTIELIRELQPNAVIFSDAGPDVRWVGNEHGYAYQETWSPLLKNEVYGGMPEYAKQYSMGQENGTHWVPAEADVSIRPGWYYHKSEDDKVKSLNHLLDIYYKSVGQNASLLLNLPLDRRGLVHENDVRQLKKLTAQLKLDFETNLAAGKPASATNTRAGSFEAAVLTDGNTATYWAAEDGVNAASITIDLGNDTKFNRILLQEFIALGQRVMAFTIEAKVNGNWKQVATEKTIGYKRILRLPDLTASEIRINITDSKACPTLSNIEVYFAPPVVDDPQISRNKAGVVSIDGGSKGAKVYYTTDGSEPTSQSTAYTAPFTHSAPVTVKAIAFDASGERQSDVSSVSFDISKKAWTIVSPSKSEADKAIDGDKWSNWSFSAKKENTAVVLDLGDLHTLKGFAYTPDQNRWTAGVITHYTLYVSKNNKKWKKVSSGEFSNIINNPVRNEITVDTEATGRYLKLEINKTADPKGRAVVAELDVITK